MATDLFTPIRLGGLELPNRIVMAPLTRNRAGQPGNVPQLINATYYAQRASAGLIITEGSPISDMALETSEIPALIENFRIAAHNAKTAGFDGVEVHGANGYLLDQFLRDGSNHRTDQYGGSIANRTRLLQEVVAAVCEVWGVDRVGVRISPLNQYNDMRDANPQALFNHVADTLRPFGVAYLHVMERDVHGTELPLDFPALRHRFNGHYIANGGYDKRRANAAIAASRADCVTFGKSYIANPDLVERYAQDAPLNVANPSTFYGGREQGYTDYPALTGDHVAPLRLPAALSLRRGSCLAPLSQLCPIPTWREPA
jgi:2,4-dienoyl-CoA reductase-like NADH-dependent reductase (Old Yellow Enzyme family)